MVKYILSEDELGTLAERLMFIIRKKDSLGHPQEQTRLAVISCIKRSFNKDAKDIHEGPIQDNITSQDNEDVAQIMIDYIERQQQNDLF